MYSTIGIEVDQVLCQTLNCLIQWHNKLYKTKLCVTDFNTPEYWKILGNSKEEIDLKLREFYESNEFDQMKPIDDFALETLKFLKKRKFKVVIVTSRPQFIAQKTKNFIDRYYPGIFDSIYFCNLRLSTIDNLQYIVKTKARICQEIGINAMIDDSFNDLLDCKKLNINLMLYDKNYEYYYNHNESLNSNTWIKRMKDWKQIYDQFPKPSSPLRNCCFTIEDIIYYTEDDEIIEEELELDLEDENKEYHLYETIEIEELSEEDEDEVEVENYLVWNEINSIPFTEKLHLDTHLELVQ